MKDFNYIFMEIPRNMNLCFIFEQRYRGAHRNDDFIIGKSTGCRGNII